MHGIELEPYKPDDTDLAFTAKMLRVLKQDGIWGNKRASLVYQKTGDNSFKLLDYMTADEAKKMGATEEEVDHIKQAQALDHHAMVACCKKLEIEMDDSIIDERGDR